MSKEVEIFCSLEGVARTRVVYCETGRSLTKIRTRNSLPGAGAPNIHPLYNTKNRVFLCRVDTLWLSL